MDFILNDMQKVFVDRVRLLMERHVAPYAAEWDENGQFPLETVTRLGQEGLLGMLVPESFGGLGIDPLTFAAVIEEIASFDGSLALTVASHNTIFCGHLEKFGNEEQKLYYLPKLASGEILGAWALAEAQAGSDAASITTKATRDGEYWVLNGAKMFVTQGSVAGLYIVFAKTIGRDKQEKISAFLIDRETPGLKAGEPMKKFGCRSSDTTTLTLKNVRVPLDHLLGREGEGLRNALQILELGRVAIGAMALGLARASLQESIAWSKQRKQFGRTIAENQAIQWMLADMATEIEAARLLVYRAAQSIGAGLASAKEAAMAKLFASETATRAANKAMQIHGGYGYLCSFALERYLRDAKLCEIGEGTSEIQRLIIARDLLKDSK